MSSRSNQEENSFASPTHTVGESKTQIQAEIRFQTLRDVQSYPREEGFPPLS